jgi:hypothetical protein
VALDYTVKGASRSIISTIDELAARADKLLEGETVVELDPESVDVSFAETGRKMTGRPSTSFWRRFASRGKTVRSLSGHIPRLTADTWSFSAIAA